MKKILALATITTLVALIPATAALAGPPAAKKEGIESKDYKWNAQEGEKIEALNRNGLAILLVEQSAREALRRSHRGYVLAGGQVRLEGPGPALLEDAEVARLYLGG